MRCQHHGAPGHEVQLSVAVSHLQHLAFLGFFYKRLALQHDVWHKPSLAYVGAHLLHELAARAPDLLTCWQLARFPRQERSYQKAQQIHLFEPTVQTADK